MKASSIYLNPRSKKHQSNHLDYHVRKTTQFFMCFMIPLMLVSVILLLSNCKNSTDTQDQTEDSQTRMEAASSEVIKSKAIESEAFDSGKEATDEDTATKINTKTDTETDATIEDPTESPTEAAAQNHSKEHSPAHETDSAPLNQFMDLFGELIATINTKKDSPEEAGKAFTSFIKNHESDFKAAIEELKHTYHHSENIPSSDQAAMMQKFQRTMGENFDQLNQLAANPAFIRHATEGQELLQTWISEIDF